MAQPLSRPGITKLIDTTLKDNSQQYITAARLRSVVNPIVDSTYGMKTIWAGSLVWQANTSLGNSNNVDYVCVTEAYADTNWFPDINEVAADGGYRQRYRITDAGVNIIADNGTTTGTIANVATTTINATPASVEARGAGARFNLTILSGQCVGIEVTNPGTGYSYSYIRDTPGQYLGDKIIPTVSFTIGGRVPTIEFSTESIVWPANAPLAFKDTDGSVVYTWNVVSNNFFGTIPIPAEAFYESTVIQLNCKDRTGTDTPKTRIAIPAIPGIPNYTNPLIIGTSSTYPHYHSTTNAAATYTIDRPFTVTGAKSVTSTNWKGQGENIMDWSGGFYFQQWNVVSNTSTSLICKADIEIRIPIINPTPVII